MLILELNSLAGSSCLIKRACFLQKLNYFETYLKLNILSVAEKVFRRNSDFEIRGLVISEKNSHVKTLTSSQRSKILAQMNQILEKWSCSLLVGFFRSKLQPVAHCQSGKSLNFPLMCQVNPIFHLWLQLLETPSPRPIPGNNDPERVPPHPMVSCKAGQKRHTTIISMSRELNTRIVRTNLMRLLFG